MTSNPCFITVIKFVTRYTCFYIQSHRSGGVLWFHVGRPCVRPSVCRTPVRPSVRPYFCIRMITSVNVDGFSPNLVCALILWRFGLRLRMGKLRHFFTKLSARGTSAFSISGDNMNNYQLIFNKLGVCIRRSGSGLLMVQFRQFCISYLPAAHP